jgi:transposase
VDRPARRAWLVQRSVVPPPPIRELRDLTRYRKTIIEERTREVQRLEKLLEDAGIKLSSVASRTLGVSGRAMIEALINGERDAAVLANLAQRRPRRKIPELTEALLGRFREHHALLAREMLGRIDAADATVGRLSEEIEVRLAPFREQIDLLITIPGRGPPHRRGAHSRDRRGHERVRLPGAAARVKAGPWLPQRSSRVERSV